MYYLKYYNYLLYLMGIEKLNYFSLYQILKNLLRVNVFLCHYCYIEFRIINCPNYRIDNNVSINFDLKETATLLLDVTDIAGKQVAIIAEERQNGTVTKQFNAAALPNGNYFVRLQLNGKTATQKLTIAH